MPGKMARSDPRASVRVIRGAGSGQRLASVLQDGRENANIDAGLGLIWRISVLATLGGGAVAWPLAARAQQQPTIGSTDASPAPTPTPTVSYTTHFPISEVPLSESGKWVQHDPNQTYVKVENIGGVQVAHGTMTGTVPCPGICNDSMAHMASGFSQNQTVTATIWKAPSPFPNTEVEIQLSWNDQNPQQNKYWGPTTSTGYEINVHYNGNYLCIGHFKEQNALMCVYNQFVPQTGDIFKAQLTVQSDQTTWIYVWWNGVLQISVHDFSPPPAGQPGIGFYIDSSARNDVFGFTSVTLTSP